MTVQQRQAYRQAFENMVPDSDQTPTARTGIGREQRDEQSLDERLRYAEKLRLEMQ